MRKIFILLIACSAYHVRAQSVGPSTLNGAGGSGTIAGNTYDWSVAEMTLVNTASASGIVVTQGVLQPYDGPNAVHDNNLLTGLLVYPNPASKEVYLQPAYSAGDELSFSLYDITGRLISKNEVKLATGKEVQKVDMERLAAGDYMLHVVLNHNNEEKSNAYKIQKVN